MAKMSKAERKEAKAKQHANEKKDKTSSIPERSFEYDADVYVNAGGEEIECVRIDFVKKPKWYEDMFRAGDIHYRNNELQARCSDGEWHAGKDMKCCLAKHSNGTIVLLADEELKEGWQIAATSSSNICSKK